MRLRIQTFRPLPELKAWFIPEIQDGQESILDLKELLCKRIQTLQDSQLRGRNLTLFLEGFELLNDSPISAVRDGDLICVKMIPSTAAEDVGLGVEPYKTVVSNERKRKRSISKTPITLPEPSRSSQSAARHAALQNLSRKSADTSDSDSQDDSSSDSEYTTSSATSSSTSSSSTSSSSSSASSTSKLHPKSSALRTRAKIEAYMAKTSRTFGVQSSPSQIPLKSHIPPGQGKPSTHSRNKRRKKQREYEKLAKGSSDLPEAPAPPKGISHTNNIPLGSSQSNHILASSESPASLPAKLTKSPQTILPLRQEFVSTQRAPRELAPSTSTDQSEYTYINPEDLMMGSLRNKNKKRGFKQSMAGPIPRKIIFGSVESHGSIIEGKNEVPQEDEVVVEDKSQLHSRLSLPRLIPPSEVQELGKLPSNIFVTSVDVEAGLWPIAHDGSKKKKKGKMARQEFAGYEDEYGVEQWDKGYANLPYSHEGGSTTFNEGHGGPQIDWEKAEKMWDTAILLTSANQVETNLIVGWKELAINPQTFTPEVLLSLAEVIAVDKGAGENSNIVGLRIRPFARPGSEAALAFGVSAGTSDHDILDGSEAEEFVGWEDVVEAQWRILEV